MVTYQHTCNATSYFIFPLEKEIHQIHIMLANRNSTVPSPLRFHICSMRIFDFSSEFQVYSCVVLFALRLGVYLFLQQWLRVQTISVEKCFYKNMPQFKKRGLFDFLKKVVFCSFCFFTEDMIHCTRNVQAGF